MRTVHIRPTHYTYHREGMPPRFRIQADEETAFVRVEVAANPRLFAPANQGQRNADNYFCSWDGGSGAPAQQLRLTSRKLVYDLPAGPWRRMAQNNMHIYFRVSASTAASPNWNAAPPQTVKSVTDEVAGRGWSPYIGAPRDPLGTPWNFPDQGVLNQVPEFYREKLRLLMRYHETHEASYLLRRLSGHANYTSLPEAQRVKALTIYASGNNSARRALLQLFEREIPAESPTGQGTPAVTNRDLSAQHATLLDNLARLVDVDPHMDIPDTMDTVIDDLLEEVADPSFELNQGTKGTCVPTSVQWIMATFFPAEYVRLNLTLLTQDMRASLANGSQAAVPADTFRFDPGESGTNVPVFLRRSWSERIFQSTMMNYARPGMSYSNMLDVFSDNRGGLTADELIRLMRGLRNVAYTHHSGTGASLAGTVVDCMQQSTQPIFLTMRWGTNGGFHQLVSTRATPTEITFRNPWGRMDYRVGQAQQSPPRRCTNPSRAEETMTRTDLAGWLTNLIMESGA